MILLTEKMHTKEQNTSFLKPLFVLERFGAAFRDKTEVNKTQLYLITKLRWNSFNNYLDWFVSKDFIGCRKESGTESYHMTENGRKILSILTILLSCIR